MKHYSKAQLRKCKQSVKSCYIESEGIVSVKKLSRVGKVPQGYIRRWIKEDKEKWDREIGKEPGDKVILTEETQKALQDASEKFDLNPQEEVFCHHYMKTLNATTSAIRAGYSPTNCYHIGNDLMKESHIREYLNYVRGKRNEEIFIDSMRVVQEYIKIAFADMTDFVKFGPEGVYLKPSNKVDGQLITKVKEGRDGVSIELADKIKALEKLDKYLRVIPDWKEETELKKINIMEEKLKLDRERLNGPEESIEDDGFMEALGLSAKEVWKNDHDDSEEED